jgi:Fur family peroxide stress response transcriptional regulator
MNTDQIRKNLVAKGLKVTPQRMAIFEAIIVLHNHPTADNILEYIRNKYPNVATGTVYKVLDALVDNELIKKVKTDKDVMRYEAEMDEHHHLYCCESNRIEDFRDEELNKYLENYFRKKAIPGFTIKDIKLQINGRFTEEEKSKTIFK